MRDQSLSAELHPTTDAEGGRKNHHQIPAAHSEPIGIYAREPLWHSPGKTTEHRRTAGISSADGAFRKNYLYKIVASPVGALKLVASGDGLAAILWEYDNPRRVRLNVAAEDKSHPILLEAERQLAEYFDGGRSSFDLRLDLAGTAFQRKVWGALLEIPFGETRSYAEIAKRIGAPNAVRAVGAANGRNPVSIVCPCHRVIGSNGKLTGFAGGLQIKAFLLRLESAQSSAWSESGG